MSLGVDDYRRAEIAAKGITDKTSRIHKTLRVPPQCRGVTDHVWSVAEIVAMIEPTEEAPAKRGPYIKSVSLPPDGGRDERPIHDGPRGRPSY